MRPAVILDFQGGHHDHSSSTYPSYPIDLPLNEPSISVGWDTDLPEYAYDRLVGKATDVWLFDFIRPEDQ